MPVAQGFPRNGVALYLPKSVRALDEGTPDSDGARNGA